MHREFALCILHPVIAQQLILWGLASRSVLFSFSVADEVIAETKWFFCEKALVARILLHNTQLFCFLNSGLLLNLLVTAVLVMQMEKFPIALFTTILIIIFINSEATAKAGINKGEKFFKICHQCIFILYIVLYWWCVELVAPVPHPRGPQLLCWFNLGSITTSPIKKS